jgi:diketogulonate reductase-like aldo/keto reductase
MNQSYITLNNGQKIPQIGLGVFFIYDANECKQICLNAFKMGYRNIDLDHANFNEKSVGEAVKESGIPREEIIITTKLTFNEYGKEITMKAIDKSLENLGTDYIDILLMNQPGPNLIDGWKEMEKAVELGKVKSIGLADFDQENIEVILKNASIKPAICQIECNPFNTNESLRNYIKEKNLNINIISWFPLGRQFQRSKNVPVLEELSKKYNKSTFQIILRWHIQNGFIIIPKSTKLNHIQANFEIFNFEISSEDMEKIELIGQDDEKMKMTEYSISKVNYK